MGCRKSLHKQRAYIEFAESPARLAWKLKIHVLGLSLDAVRYFRVTKSKGECCAMRLSQRKNPTIDHRVVKQY
jgi:hypothetical protein